MEYIIYKDGEKLFHGRLKKYLVYLSEVGEKRQDYSNRTWQGCKGLSG